MAIPQSVRSKIIDAAQAALNNGADRPGTFFRTRADALGATELPAYLMSPTQDDAQRVTGSTVERILTLHFEAMTAGGPPQDEALDPLLTYVPLTLWADATFRGLVQSVLDAHIAWEFKDGEQDYALAALDLKITYLAAAVDPSVAKAGYSGVVSWSLNGTDYNEMAELADVLFDVNTDMQEATNLDSIGYEYVAGWEGWKATARQLFLKDDAAQAALYDARAAGVSLFFRFDPAGEGSGNMRLQGTGKISRFSFGQQPTPQEPMWQDLQIQGCGALVRTAQ